MAGVRGTSIAMIKNSTTNTIEVIDSQHASQALERFVSQDGRTVHPTNARNYNGNGNNDGNSENGNSGGDIPHQDDKTLYIPVQGLWDMNTGAIHTNISKAGQYQKNPFFTESAKADIAYMNDLIASNLTDIKNEELRKQYRENIEREKAISRPNSDAEKKALCGNRTFWEDATDVNDVCLENGAMIITADSKKATVFVVG